MKRFLVFLMLLVAGVANAATYCVGPSSTGAGTGADWNNRIALSGVSFVRGNTYYLASGIYSGGLTLNTPSSGTTLITIQKATDSSHGTDTGWVSNSSSFGLGAATMGTSGLSVQSSYWVMDGMVGGGPGAWTNNLGIRFTAPISGSDWIYGINYGIGFLTFRHCAFIGNWVSGLNSQMFGMGTGSGGAYVTDLTFDHCAFWNSGNNTANVSANNFKSLYCYWGSFGGSNPGSGGHLEWANMYPPGQNWTFAYNYCKFGQLSGAPMTAGWVLLGSGTTPVNAYFYGNIFECTGVDSTGGNGMIGGNSNYALYGVYFYNNTIVHNPSMGGAGGIFLMATAGKGYGNCFFENNLIADCDNINVNGATVQDYNHYANNSVGQNNETHVSASSGEPFNNWAAGDYSLKANTPPGVNLGPPYNVDMFGNTRSTWTRGALEFSNTAPTWLYCSPTGTGTGVDAAHPCSVSYGLSHTTAGNTLAFLDGDYTGEIDIGTSGITLVSLNKWKARILNPAGANFSSGLAIYPNGTHNVTIDGFCVTNCLANGISSFGPSNVIKNCWVTHVGTAGYNGPGNGGGYGIYCKSQAANIVDSCLVEYNGSVPSYDQAIYVGGTNAVVRNCVSRYNAAFGIQYEVFSGKNDQCYCYNNLCYSNAVLGGNAFEFSMGADSGSAFGTNYFYGNTFLSRRSTVCYVNNGVILLTNNIIQGSFATGANGTIRSGNNLSNPNPNNFVSPDSGLFWLTASSVARNVAISSACGSVNFFSASQSSVTDDGFVQYTAALAADGRTLDPAPTGADYWGTPTVGPPPTGTTYYVSPTGSSGNGGTIGSPWPIDYAVAHVGDSNTIIALDGVYQQSSALTVVNHGVTLKAQNKWKAWLVNSPAEAIRVSWPNDVVYNRLTVDGFAISNAMHSAISIYTGTNHVVRNCWIMRTGQTYTGAAQNQSGITSDALDNMLFENNLIEYNGHLAVFDHGLYVGGTNCIIRNNVIRYNVASGTAAGVPTHNARLYNNLIYGNGTGGSEGGIDGMEISLWSTLATDTNYIYGNTLITTNPFAIEKSLCTVLLTNNIIISSADGLRHSGGANTYFADYNLAPRALYVTGTHDVISSTYGFVNSGHGLYWITTGSAARTKALAGVFGPVDFFGNSQSSVADIGAFQYSGTLAGDVRILDPSPAAGADYWAIPVGSPPAIQTAPTNTWAIAGSTLVDYIGAVGNAPLAYQWYFTNVTPANSISGQTAALFAITNVTTAWNNRRICCLVTNSFGSITSSVVFVTVTNAPSGTPPTINTQPTNAWAISGTTLRDYVGASASTPLAYQWYAQTNGTAGNAIANQTNALLSVASVTVSLNTNLCCVVTNTYGAVTSAVVFATVTNVPPPTITTQPTNAWAVAGTTLRDYVVASGNGLSYQWYAQSNPVPGNAISTQTNALLSIAGVSTAYNTNLCVVVMNTWGSVTSAVVSATVTNAPPTIQTQPTNCWAIVGTMLTDYLAANGTAPLSYQWYSQSNPVPGNAIAGQTGPTLLVGNAPYSLNTNLCVVVTNIAGSITSSVVFAYVTNDPVWLPKITQQPQSKTVTVGQNATFTVSSTGMTNQYQWCLYSVPITGATTVSYTKVNCQTPDTGDQFTVIVSNSFSSVTSSVAVLTVQPLVPLIQITPVGGLSPTGLDFGVVATNTSQFLSINVTNVGQPGSVLNGLASSALPFTISNGDYSLAVGAGKTVQVYYSPTSQGKNSGTIVFTGGAGTNASATGIALNVLPIANLQVKDALLLNDFTLSGNCIYGTQNYIGGVLSPDPSAGFAYFGFNSTSNGSIRFKYVGQGTNIANNSWYANVNGMPVDPYNICDVPVATGFQTNYISWRGNGTDVSDQFPSNSFPVVNGFNYLLIIGRESYSVISNIFVSPPPTPPALPVITVQPTSQTIYDGLTSTFSLAATGVGLTYQWYSNSVSIPGATSASFTTPAMYLTNNNDRYYCAVTTSGGSVSSTTVTLTVNIIQVQPSNATTVVGHNVVFSTTVSTTETPTYQWYLAPSTVIAGATASSYTKINCQISDGNSQFSCLVTVPSGFAMTTSATLTVNPETKSTSKWGPSKHGFLRE